MTLTVAELEMLGLKLLPPEYDATTLSVPSGSKCVENMALPSDNVTGEPKSVPLSKNCIVPVAVLGDTLAVKVTEWRKIIEVAFELRDVVVSDAEI